jgi:glycosyltransferase involved in cell wall biosynthesis
MDFAMPVVVISFNRGEYLRRVISGYLRQELPLQIVIHDNGSDDPETQDTLLDLEKRGFFVYRKPKINNADDLNLVNDTVEAVLDGRTLPYVVTDCDIDLSIARRDAIQLYLELLSLRPDVECVGPMLRIADIPKRYPLFGRVMESHIDQFWHRQPEWISTSVGEVAVLTHAIDTSFAVHRGGTPFRRLRPGLRAYQPFEALHLDWYIDEGQAHSPYALTSSPLISHWDNAEALAEFQGRTIPEQPFFIVEGDIGKLQVMKRYAVGNPA